MAIPSQQRTSVLEARCWLVMVWGLLLQQFEGININLQA